MSEQDKVNRCIDCKFFPDGQDRCGQGGEVSDKDAIEKLKDGESYIVPESDYGKAEIWKKNSMYFLFEIPMYGGEPRFIEAYGTHRIDDMIKQYNSWA